MCLGRVENALNSMDSEANQEKVELMSLGVEEGECHLFLLRASSFKFG